MKAAKNSLYAFLEPFLASGNEEFIKAARKEYERQYKAEWRRNQRKRTIQFTIPYTQDEAKSILEAAKKHRRSRSAYIKAASLSYDNSHFVVPDLLAVSEIRELLAKNYTALQDLFTDNPLPFQYERTLLEKIVALEQEVLSKLQYPKTVEKWVIDTIKSEPAAKEKIIRLLEKL